MRLTVDDGIEVEVSEEVGALLQAMLARRGANADGVTHADVARARFDAETLQRSGSLAPLALNEDGEVDLEAARRRFDAAARTAWRWGTLAPG